MPCLSTTLLRQRRGNFHGLLRMYVGLFLVLAFVGEATSIRFVALDILLVAGPFVLYYLAYHDLLGTKRFHRYLKWQQKRDRLHRRLKRQQEWSNTAQTRAKDKAKSDTEAAWQQNKRSEEASRPDTESANKQGVEKKGTMASEAGKQQQQHEPSAQHEALSNKVARTKKWKENRDNKRAEGQAKQRSRNEAVKAQKAVKAKHRAESKETVKAQDQPSEPMSGQRFLLGLWHYLVRTVHFCVTIVEDEQQELCTRLALFPSVLLWLPAYTSMILSVRSLLGFCHCLIGIVRFCVCVVYDEQQDLCTRLAMSPSLILWLPSYTSMYTSVTALLGHSYTWLVRQHGTETVCGTLSLTLHTVEYWCTQCAEYWSLQRPHGLCDPILFGASLLSTLRAESLLVIGLSSTKLRLRMYQTKQQYFSMAYRTAKRYCLRCATDDHSDPILRTACLLLVFPWPTLFARVYRISCYYIVHGCYWDILSTLASNDCNVLMDLACVFLCDLSLARHLCGRAIFDIHASPPLLLQEHLAIMLAASVRPCHCDTCFNTYEYELEEQQCHYCREAAYHLLSNMSRHNAHEPQPADPHVEVR